MVHFALTLLLLVGSASSWGGSDSKAPKLLTKDGRARSFTITKTDTTSQGVSLVSSLPLNPSHPCTLPLGRSELLCRNPHPNPNI